MVRERFNESRKAVVVGDVVRVVQPVGRKVAAEAVDIHQTKGRDATLMSL